MMVFMNLLQDELRRLRPLLFALLALIVCLEIPLLIIQILRARDLYLAAPNNYSPTSITQIYGELSFSFLLMMAMIAGLLAYVFFSWLREWWFQEKFIYRLLLLPAPKVLIAYAKIGAALIIHLVFIGLQLLILISLQVLATQLPYLTQAISFPVLLAQTFPLLTLWFPMSFELAVLYLLALLYLLVIVSSIAIVIGSYRTQGILTSLRLLSAILFANLAVWILVIYLITTAFVLTMTEIIIAVYLTVAIILLSAMALMHYLMKHYITI